MCLFQEAFKHPQKSQDKHSQPRSSSASTPSYRYTSRGRETTSISRNGANRIGTRVRQLKQRTQVLPPLVSTPLTADLTATTPLTRLPITTTSTTPMPTTTVKPLSVDSKEKYEAVVRLHPVYKRLKLPEDTSVKKKKSYKSSTEIRKKQDPDFATYDDLYDPAPVGPRYTTKPTKPSRVLTSSRHLRQRQSAKARQKPELSKTTVLPPPSEIRDNTESSKNIKTETFSRNTESSGKTLAHPSRFSKPTTFPSAKAVRIPKPRLVNPTKPLPRPELPSSKHMSSHHGKPLVPKPIPVHSSSSELSLHNTFHPGKNDFSSDNFAVLDEVFRFPGPLRPENDYINQDFDYSDDQHKTHLNPINDFRGDPERTLTHLNNQHENQFRQSDEHKITPNKVQMLPNNGYKEDPNDIPLLTDDDYRDDQDYTLPTSSYLPEYSEEDYYYSDEV